LLAPEVDLDLKVRFRVRVRVSARVSVRVRVRVGVGFRVRFSSHLANLADRLGLNENLALFLGLLPRVYDID
jgi:hypothetical protein